MAESVAVWNGQQVDKEATEPDGAL